MSKKRRTYTPRIVGDKRLFSDRRTGRMGIFHTLRRLIAPSPQDQAVKVVRGLLLSDLPKAEYLAKAAHIYTAFADRYRLGRVDAFASEPDANAALEILLTEVLHDQHLHELGLSR